ncbi:MAG: roadblock/LC7 domain-containing protein [Anaerolineales bacterium]|nr:MAG: roadblock/LC7 domain-containing protein [Anaerolineales bacterium]
MDNSKSKARPSTSASLQGALTAAYKEGGFRAVVLASTKGLPIATVPAGYSSDTTAALIAVLRKAGSEAQKQLGLADVDEVTIRTSDGARIVCRELTTGEQTVILVASVPPDTSYRRVTNRAVARIRKALS